MRVNETPTFTANAALARYLRVALSSNKLIAAGAADDEIGTIPVQILAADKPSAVIPSGEPCVRKVVAAGAITLHANIYRAAGGKVSATPNGERWGIALETASADGSEINAMQTGIAAQVNLVEAHTAGDTLLAAELYGSVHTSVGAAGAVTLILPAAVVGMHGKFRVGATQELRLDPAGTETIALPSTGLQGAAGKYLTANANGETVSIACDKAGQWSVYGFTGTWTAQA